MLCIIGIGIRNAREEILKLFVRQQIAVGQRFLAEFGQERIARFINLDVKAAIIDLLGIDILGRLCGLSHSASKCLARLFSDQLFAAFILLIHCHSLCLFRFGCSFGRRFPNGLLRCRFGCFHFCHIIFLFKTHRGLICTTKFSHRTRLPSSEQTPLLPRRLFHLRSSQSDPIELAVFQQGKGISFPVFAHRALRINATTPSNAVWLRRSIPQRKTQNLVCAPTKPTTKY